MGKLANFDATTIVNVDVLYFSGDTVVAVFNDVSTSTNDDRFIFNKLFTKFMIDADGVEYDVVKSTIKNHIRHWSLITSQYVITLTVVPTPQH